jgi:hypothetical protein
MRARPGVLRGARVGAAVDVGVMAALVVEEERAHGAPGHPQREGGGLARSERVRGAPPCGLALRRFHAEVLSDRSGVGQLARRRGAAVTCVVP